MENPQGKPAMFRKYHISIPIESWLYKQGNLRTSQRDRKNWILPPGIRNLNWNLNCSFHRKNERKSGKKKKRAKELGTFEIGLFLS